MRGFIGRTLDYCHPASAPATCQQPQGLFAIRGPRTGSHLLCSPSVSRSRWLMRIQSKLFGLFRATQRRLEPAVFILFCFSNQIAHPCRAMLMVRWEPVPADLMGLNGKLPSGSRRGAVHTRSAVPGCGETAPGLLGCQGKKKNTHTHPCFFLPRVRVLQLVTVGTRAA